MKKFLTKTILITFIFFYFLLLNLYSGLRDYAAQKNFYIGPAVTNNPLRNETQYRNTIISEFNQMVGENEFKMYIWTGPYSYNFTTTDYYVNFAQQNNIRLRGHCLVWYAVVPDWLRNGNYSSDEVRAMLEAYIKAVVGRYKGKIAEWDVVNEAVSDSSPYGYRSNDFWYQKLGDYIPLAFQWAHEADPDCKLYYNDYGAEGMGGKADAVYNLVSRLKSQGVPIHGVGWQSHWGYNSFLGDNNYENLQRLVALGLDVEVTELDLAIDNPDSSKLAIQAHNYANFTFFCMTHPKVKRMMMWGFTDKYTWLGSEKAPLIFDTNYNKKPAYYAIEAVLKMQPSGGIYNGGFEDNVYCWVPVGNVNISENTSVYRSGTRSALVSNRTQPYQGIGQHVLWYLLEKGAGTYQASCFMRLASGTDQGKITLFIRDDSGNRYITLASGNINNSNFSQVSGQATITWNGLLRVARLYIETQNSSSDFYVDDVSFSKVEQAPPQQYSLTVNINPSVAGSVTLNPSGGVYVAGTTVTLTAVASSGWVFSGWGGSLTGSQNPATIVMDSSKTVTANFVRSSYTLTVNINPSGAGSVTLNPSGGVYVAGTTVTLTAVANSGWVFSSWSGSLTGSQNPATIVMDSSKTVTANFVRSSYTLTVNINPSGAGSVTLNPSGGVYVAGTTVTLTAVASSGWVFSGWSGSLTGSQNPATIVMNSSKTVTANFVQQSTTTQQPQRYTLTIDINPQFGGIVELNPQGGEYVAGTTVTLTAVANSGWVFSGWGGDLSGDQNPVNIVMDSNKNVIVNFIEISSGVVGGTTGYIMIDISSRVISGVVGIVVRLEGYNVSEVSKVRLYLNGILIGEDVDGLDGYVFSLDSRGYGDGVYILKVEVVGLGGVVLGERDEEVEIKNVGGGVGGEGGGSGGSSGDVSGREINSKTNKLYINLTNKQTETILVNKTEVEWIKVYDLKGKLIDSYDGDILDVKRVQSR
jgi:endo-1,4-beta-xylanase